MEPKPEFSKTASAAALVEAVLEALPAEGSARARLGAPVLVRYSLGGRGDGDADRPPWVELGVEGFDRRDVTKALGGRPVWTFLRHLRRAGLPWELLEVRE